MFQIYCDENSNTGSTMAASTRNSKRRAGTGKARISNKKVLSSRNANIDISKGIVDYESLSRKELQSLAKQHGIRANAKSSEIIRCLREQVRTKSKSTKRGLSKTVMNDENQDPKHLENRKAKKPKQNAPQDRKHKKKSEVATTMVSFLKYTNIQ